MSAHPRSGGSLLPVRIGVAVAAILAVASVIWLVRTPSRAEAAPLSAESPAVFQTKDQMLVTVALANPEAQDLKGTLRVELLGPDNQSLGKAEQDIKQKEKAASYRFELPAVKVPLEQIKLRCEFNKQRIETDLHKVLLVKAHETSVASGQEFHAGSSAALRCGVHGVKSWTDSVPLPGARVEVRLRAADGKVFPLFEGKADADGIAQAQFQVPAVPAGSYTLEVATESTLGKDKLERAVKIKTEPKVLLTTDKPLYQPGQLINIRALALQAFDLTPVDGKELTFEVEDSKGNKVFKRAHKTSDFGIASVEFQLADEVNMGDYQVRAILGDVQAQKTVTVKRYVLPKFKAEVSADKRFYMPKETIQAELQADYFFGKPVANAKFKVTASTFDVAFKEFKTYEGKTDAQGHAKFEIQLPDYFVGTPLQKGDALVRLEVKLTDSADHSETISKSYTVSDQPIRVSVIPERGLLVPAMENRVWVAAIYPDGSPAKCDVKLWHDPQAQPQPVPGFRGGPVPPPAPQPAKKDRGQPLATVQTNEAGLAEFRITPKGEQFRQGDWGERKHEMLGGRIVQAHGPKMLFDLHTEAKDAKGSTATASASLNSEPMGENVLLRLDRAIYKGGDSLNVDVLTSAGLPTAYLDIVKGGQTLLTKWLDVKDGKASHRMDLPAGVFGTLEVHAYQMLASGEIIRDARVVYVHPNEDLRIEVKADQDVYLPGKEGQIRFQVTDAKGKPTAAALGIIVVDEAVYALQDMQPGLEKVYFTLQEELTKPQVSTSFRPGEPIDVLIRQPELPPTKQQIAQVLLAPIVCKAPARWEVNPAVERRQKVEAQVQQLGFALFNWGSQNHFLEYDKKGERWVFKTDTLANLKKHGFVNDEMLKDPFGGPLDLDSLAKIEKQFTPDQLARSVTQNRIQNIQGIFLHYTNVNKAKLLKKDVWTFPDTVLADAAKNQGVDQNWINTWTKDPWGESLKVVKVDKKRDHKTGATQFDYHEIVSAGPDRKFGTEDDVRLGDANQWQNWQVWWGREGKELDDLANRFGDGGGRLGMDRRTMMMQRGGGGGPVPEMAMPLAAPGVVATAARPPVQDAKAQQGQGQGEGGGAAPMRVREYFPETLLWKPALITNDRGEAVLPITFADSITTWRLSASASSRGGALGGVSAPLRVFQDFFVDLDLPVSLTQNDEVAFPVAVYNYLKQPQTVKLELVKASWFELVDGEATRSLDLKPNEVTAVKFRIRANRIGYQPLQVNASGSKMSDAIKRTIDIVPDGAKVEKVVTDRLTGKVAQTITIPEHAIPDASKLLVKIYPGVFSQVIEGTEGMLQMPGGCFEQTSSSAYPNIMVVDYIKKARLANPQMLMKAETYLNAGYQRLLTFERPGGGFDWWGSGPPLVWLSAYGLQEFNDMSKVWPIDRGIIDRTQAWLMAQREPDGTWSKIGATHGESIERMGDAKLLLTSYVVWSLLDSGLKSKELDKSVAYIHKHAKEANNPYILALAANALASWDPKDDYTLEVLQKLEKLRQEKAEWKACCWVPQGQSLAYARGDSLSVETTALAVLAMLKTSQFTNSVNQGLTFLVKSKDGAGTWGNTQATILALKALVAGLGGAKQEGKAAFTILVNSKEAAKGEVTPDNADVLQLFDLKDFTQVGDNRVEIQVEGQTNLMYQIVGRYFEPHTKSAAPTKPALDIAVEYDRTKLATSDLLKAKATMRYTGEVPTYMVIVDLGIPPGFTVDAGEFAELVGARKVEKFSVTARQVTLYLGDVKPGDTRTFEYTLKPKYPIRAKTPASVVYEYNTPANRATTKPVELTVVEK